LHLELKNRNILIEGIGIFENGFVFFLENYLKLEEKKFKRLKKTTLHLKLSILFIKSFYAIEEH
jgi:hypothetical protein